MSEQIFHIMREKCWCEALELGEYRDASLEREGFIHCSTRSQVERVANHLFQRQNGLVLLRIDPDLAAAEIRYEPSGGEDYPHLYGPLNLDAVKKVIRFEPDDDGDFHFPEQAIES